MVEEKWNENPQSVELFYVAKVTPKITFYTGEDVVAFVKSKNENRRHLTTGQKAVVADKWSEYSSVGGDRKSEEYHSDNCRNDLTQTEAAKEQGVSEKSVQRVRKLRNTGNDDLYDAVADGTLSVNKALQKAKRRENAERREEYKNNPLPLPENNRYDIILADPPWTYDFSSSQNRDLENQYPTMSLEDIKAMDVDSLTEDNSVLYLWTTAPKLVEGLQVTESWGFEYKTNMVWDKERMGMGRWTRVQHEHLLIGTKGTFSPPDDDVRKRSIISEKATQHSVKPEKVYEIIEEQFPDKTKLELFARTAREGWGAWGNEVTQSE